MPVARNGSIEIYYEQRAPRIRDRSPARGSVLLIMGLGSQLIHWPQRLVTGLADAGHPLVLLDNRDVGLSSKLTSPAGTTAHPWQPVYGLDDMARDCVAVLDAIGVERAHVVGASLGGMIGQVLALEHGPRVRSLVSIMSSTGSPEVPAAKPEVTQHFVRRLRPASDSPAARRAAAIDATLTLLRTLAVHAEDFDESRARELTRAAIERGFEPRGIVRQLAAILSASDREPRLRELDVPCLVVHGEDDPLIPIQGGERTHACIAGSQLLRIPRMGHCLADRVLDPILQHLLPLLAEAEAVATGAAPPAAR